MDLEGVMPSEISQRKTNPIGYRLYVGLRKLNSQKQSAVVVSRSWGLREREDGGQGYELPVVR